MRFQGAAFLLAAFYWILTAFYGIAASQAFIQEQFLAPRLLPPVAFFADWHPAIGVALLAPWAAIRLLGARDGLVVAALGVSAAGVASLALMAPLSGAQTGTTSLTAVIAGLAATAILAVAEWVPSASDSGTGSASSGDRSVADLVACLLAGIAAAAAQGIAAVVVTGAAPAPAVLAHSLRLYLLLGGAAFLCLAIVRAVADLSPRRTIVARALTGGALATTLAAFVYLGMLASISIRGAGAVAIAAAMGAVLALAVLARGAGQGAATSDGVVQAFTTLAPRLAREWWGFAVWTLMLGAVAAAVATLSSTADWNFVLARTGAVIVWVMALSAGIAVTQRMTTARATLARTTLAFATAGVILVGHVWLPGAAPVQAAAALDPGARWLGELLERADKPVGGTDIVDLLHARTNIPRGTSIAPVDVSFAALTGEPSPQRPHIFVFVVDSLRRDYLSPYNSKVTFTPSIAALAEDSLVFRNAFTQYGATGLSVPSLWVGGPILHKQYVTPFAPMNSLDKLLTHERYAQLVGMDNIMDVILPASDRRERLDPGVAVKDFRLCNTLGGIRERLATRTPEEPVFVYSLPQDLHVSVVAREGISSIDGAPYEGFYAPVASRVAKLDACLGAFVSDLKARGLYDESIIIITSDHGDSLGEDGRMGHAYSLHPEVVRVPLIVRVPAALRSQWSWDEDRPAFTTDLTPTLYRLLGHDTRAPAEFFGESLAHPAGVALQPSADRMIAASYGAVYGALLDEGRRYYVFDAIAMRELAFEIGSDAAPGTAIPVTGEMQQRGLAVIRRTVDDISRFYRYPPAAATRQLATRQ
jgi:hypothetical protein